MKYLYSFFIILNITLINSEVKSQILNENFNTGLPASWTQSSTAAWSFSSSLGTSSSGCIVSEDLTLTLPTKSLQTPILNLSGITSLTISFKLALVGNNFIVPDMALSYNAGTGPQFMARWGSGYSSNNTTYTISYNDYDYDYQPPLNAEHVIFTTCTHTVSAITGSMVSFVFDAEFVNGGYVLIDDVKISGVLPNTTGIDKNDPSATITLFPNPVVNKKVTLNHKNISKIFVYDQLGKNIPVDFIKKGEVLEADLNALPTGIYYLNIVTEDRTVTIKKIVLE